MALGTTGNNSAAATGELTQAQVHRILVQRLEERSVFLSAGPTIFNTNGSNVRVPKQAAPTNPTWVGENEAVPEVNPDFDEVNLLPETMKSVATLVRVSNALVAQSIVAIDQALESRLLTDVANTLDKALIASTVTDGTQPTGLLSYAGVQVLPVNGALSYDNLLDAWGLALTANVNIANLKWIMRPETFVALSKTKTATGSNEYIQYPDVTQDGTFRLFGSPVIVTTHVPTTGATGSKKTQAALVDFSNIAVARDVAPRLAYDRSRFFEFRQTAFLAETRYDATPLNSQAVVRLDGINAAG